MLKQLKNLKDDVQAVSPVVATLMLVLVAAGAAVGVGVFMNGIQDDAQESVNTDVGNKQLLRIGGSSTVYEFSEAAIDGFEAANPNIKIELESGGSGAGRAGVCNGAVDLGSASSPIKTSHQDTCKQLSGGKTMEVFKVATDGVVFATLSSNSHCGGALALTEANALEIYIKNGKSQGTWAGSVVPANALTADIDTAVTYGDLDGINGMTCGVDAQEIIIFDREDPGGTSEIASEKLFGQDGKQLEDFGLTLPDSQQGDGNQGVLTTVQGHASADDALFFTSFGYAEANSLTVHDFGTASPATPSSSTIADGTYDATRPIQYMTLGEPSPLEQIWLDYVMNTHTNQELASAADFESIY